MSHLFATLDVFTDEALAGNPLAVVFDADDLGTERMQAIAREFALSETVFVLSSRDPVNSARIRIFTPVRELPFAGHPTVGAAVILAMRRAPEIIARQDLSVVLEEEIGLVTCTVRRHRGITRASFSLPRLPARLGDPVDATMAAAALGLDPSDIGYAGHAPALTSAGVPFVCVPLAGLLAAGRVGPDLGLWDEAFGHHGVYLYTPETTRAEAQLHARMFAPRLGVPEDPATGSAVAALAALLAEQDGLADGDHTVVIEQGIEMGRPSLITLGMEMAGGRLVAASIGGAAVVLTEGNSGRMRAADAPVYAVERVDALRCRYDPAPWPFAVEHGGAIGRHWAQALRARPRLFNGRVLIQTQGDVERGSGAAVFRAAYTDVDFAAFLAWRDWGFPRAGVRNGFGMAALETADGAFVLGEMAPHTANAGRIYFPSGTPDLSDIEAGMVDIPGSIRRELLEETGLDPETLDFDPTITVLSDAVCVCFMQRVRASETAAALIARIEAALARQAIPELARVHLVRSMADLTAAMPPFVTQYLRLAFAA